MCQVSPAKGTGDLVQKERTNNLVVEIFSMRVSGIFPFTVFMAACGYKGGGVLAGRVFSSGRSEFFWWRCRSTAVRGVA